MIRESETGRNWQRYAERTPAYAFGYAGDRDIARNARYRELWRQVEGQAKMEHKRRRIHLLYIEGIHGYNVISSLIFS